MIKKKYFLVSGLLLTSLLLGSCSSNSSGGSQKETVVEFFSQKPEITDQLKDLANTYSKEHENVRVNITTVGSGEGSAALQAKFTSGDEPALMMLGGLPEVERYKKTLMDVSDMEVVDTVAGNLLEGGTIDDVPLGVPMNLEGFGWMYNKELFEKAGVDPDNIKTYDDFVSAVEQLDQQKDDLGMDAVFGYSGGEDYITNQFSANFTSPEFDDSILEAYDAKELKWEYGDQMKKYTDLINQYNVQPILSVDYSQSVEKLFVNDKVAIVHQGNWIIPTLNGLDPDFVENKLGILPVFGENDTEGKVVVGAPWYIGINKNLDQKVVEAATDFLNWMYLSDEGQDALLNEFNYIPPQEGYEVDRISDPVSQEIYQALLDGKTAAMTHKQYPDGYFQSSLFPEFQKYLNGDISWEDFEANTSKAFSEMR